MSRCVAPAQQTVSTTTRQTDFAASPKVQQMRLERTQATSIQTGPELTGYRPTGPDGITASPKLRAQLGERQQAVQIAPVK